MRILQDIAPFTLLPETAWDVERIDFSLPYKKQKTDAVRQELNSILAELGGSDPEVKKIRSIAYHNLEAAKAMLKQR